MNYAVGLNLKAGPDCVKPVEPFKIALTFQTNFDPFKKFPEVIYLIFCP
jgi:hypothetical protein